MIERLGERISQFFQSVATSWKNRIIKYKHSLSSDSKKAQDIAKNSIELTKCTYPYFSFQNHETIEENRASESNDEMVKMKMAKQKETLVKRRHNSQSQKKGDIFECRGWTYVMDNDQYSQLSQLWKMYA